MINNPTVRLLIYSPIHITSLLLKGHFWGPLSLVTEITSKCNLDCPLCYWKERSKKKELTDKEWIKKVDKIITEHPGLSRAVWAGGEPMLRLNLLKKLSRNFLHNTIVTNGTIPLRKIRNTEYRVSIDGTKEYFEKQRGSGYDKIKSNIIGSDAGKIVINCLISRINESCLEDFVAEWTKIRKVKEIKFSFYTPNINDPSSHVWLGYKERDAVIERLENLAKEYPDHLKESVEVLKAFLSPNIRNLVKRCHKNPPIFLDSSGNKLLNQLTKKKVRCNHPNARCEKCGHPCSMKASHLYNNRFAILKKLFTSRILD